MAKQERARRTRQRILDAAAAEFAFEGYAGTTLHRIAERAGMTKGALQGHFSCKEALAHTVTTDGMDRGLEVLAALGRTSTGGDSPMSALIRRVYEDLRLRAGLELLTDPVLRKDTDPRELTWFHRALVDLLGVAEVEGVDERARSEEVAHRLLVTVCGMLRVHRAFGHTFGIEVCTDPCLLQLMSLTTDRKGDRTSP
ncbi:transcriptional regulator, TetR family [Actinopolyspora lacussalsi subsp. righensis]|uniref:Transcriptional regulator, TetR family n=1 Tax=Actinopolyspora righensis TaxID=995060 RepID=A0A1I7AJV9_9ACTN|nr:TetR/AcrR family transcriptional regulator [Actinopolyspora righensis]SFT75269.1 transcriptional regulator, TetR family [Actinopolyspora righensis]